MLFLQCLFLKRKSALPQQLLLKGHKECEEQGHLGSILSRR